MPGLDTITAGGWRVGGLHLVIGEPGAGKTILAHQIGTAVARAGGTTLYLTAMIEGHQTLLAQARTLRFFDASLVGSRFYYASIAGPLGDRGTAGAREEIIRLVHEHEPTLLVLDGLHTLRLIGDSELEFHRLLVALQAQAVLTGTTTIAIANYDGSRPADAMFAIPDSIIHLRTERHDYRELRLLSIEKMRATPFISGWHTARLSGDGMHVYPRLEAYVETQGLPPTQPGDRTYDFGIAGLDAMLKGGVSSGSVTLLAGAPGSGKTLSGLAFLAAGAAAGDAGLYVGFREADDRVLAKAAGVGIGLREHVESGRVTLHWTPPLEVLCDSLGERILSTVEERGVRRLFVDGLDDLRRTCVPERRFPSFLAALTDVLRARGIGVLFSQEFRRPFGLDLSLPVEEMSGAIDNIILFRYVEQQARLRRLVSILKMRDHEYDTSIREFRIAPSGFTVGDPFPVGRWVPDADGALPDGALPEGD